MTRRYSSEKLKAMLLKVPKARYIWATSYFLLGKSALHKVGWFRSVWSGEPVDRNGRPIPWITYPCIHFLETRIQSSHRIFEYGSGNSTLWFAKRAKSIVSVEHDRDWHRYMKRKLPDNARIRYVPLGDSYPKAILDEEGFFDIIVIDGRMRVSCAQRALNRLGRTGVLVWDNTDRKEYARGIRYLRNKGFKQLDFVGQFPSSPRNSVTSIFYRQRNVFDL